MAPWSARIKSKDGGLLRGMSFSEPELPEGSISRHVVEALAANKQEGLTLAVRARWIALSITAVLLFMTIPTPQVIYYYVLLIGLAFIGWLQLRAGKVGRSNWELNLIRIDVALIVFGMLFPNPFFNQDWPNAIQFKFENFKYLYIFLASITLGYSWRTVIAYGFWTFSLWTLGTVAIFYFGSVDNALSERLLAAVQGDLGLFELLDPSNIRITSRIEELAVFLIVTAILGVNSFRMNRLLLRQASTIRERENLARHFPPNMVEELAEQDQPFGEVREQNVAVMFVDIVGFTRMAEQSSPKEVVGMLRDFHRIVEEAVFEHDGTLDKYLGDGVMASFGTPINGEHDATDALRCSKLLTERMAAWNIDRLSQGEVVIQFSMGLHFGPVILGDIGTERRMEFAMLGDAVNVASRLEEMTRKMGSVCIISDDLVSVVKQETKDWKTLLKPYSKTKGVQPILGRETGVSIWSCKPLVIK